MSHALMACRANVSVCLPACVCGWVCVKEKVSDTHPDHYEYGQMNLSLPLQLQSGKYHPDEQAVSPYS